MGQEEDSMLIFVYNADSGGLFTGLKDTLHKTFRKSTYECNLCQVTFGAFGMKKDWKNFVNDLDVPVEFKKKDKFKFDFLHKDEFNEKFKVADAKFPSAYILDDGTLKLFISQDEMNSVKEIEELKNMVVAKIEEFNL